MSLKDHPVLIAIAACAATAASTWAVSEQVRVLPIEKRLSAQLERNHNAPVISDIKLTKVQNGNSLTIEQNVSYSDPNGDAAFLNWIVLQTNYNGIRVTSGSIGASKEEQISGANQLGKWDCGPAQYYIKFRVIVTDRAGNASEPNDFTINCNS